ncbi:MAG: hypothetical protein ABSB97_02445 [Thermoplasmata archaeon]|jgi:hypothetical protein
MLLLSGERVVRSAYAVIEPDHRPEGVRGPGVLYLTNYRVVFEAPASKGVVRGRETRVVFSSSLHELTDLTVRRGRLGKPRLVMQAGTLRPTFDVLEPDAWVALIAHARRTFPPPGSVPSLVIERQVVKVRCRYCGSLANEVDGRCPYCGAAL